MTFEDIINYFPKNNQETFADIKTKIAKNQLIPFIGAGLSIPFGYKSWNESLLSVAENISSEIKKEEISKKIKESSFDGAQLLEDVLGERVFRKAIGNEFSNQKIKNLPEETIKESAVYLIPKIFKENPVITTNFDEVIENIYAKQGSPIKPITPYENALNDQLRQGNAFGLLKLHGSIGDTLDYKKIIFTKEQYDKAYGKNSEITVLLKNWFNNKQLFFLGCSLNNDKTIELLKNIAFESTIDHYAIVPCKKDDLDERRKELSEYGICAIFYPEGEHESVRIILEQLLGETKETINEPIEITRSPSNITDDEFLHRTKELKELKELLKQNRPVIIINGLGGIGKTTICNKLYNDIKADYSCCGWYNYKDSIKNTLLNQTMLFPDVKNYEERFNKILDYLQNTPGKKLICIDNLNDINCKKDKDLKAITGIQNISLLSTSRLDGIDGFMTYGIKLMNEKECIDLFKKNCNREIDESLIKKYISLVSCHTLGVELLAKTVNYSLDSPKEFYDLLKDKGFQFPKLETELRYSAGESKTISDHLKKLFDISNLNSEERRILSYFSIMPSIVIPYSVVKMIGCDENNLINLCKTGWLSNEPKGYKMHPLIQQTIKLDIDKYPIDLGKEIIDHLLDGDYLNEKEIYNEKLSKLEIATSIVNFYKFGNDHTDTADTYNNLAILYETLGNYKEAEEFYLKALKISEKVLGNDHPNTASIYNNLAALYSKLGNYKEAEEFYLKALKIEEKVLGNDHPNTATLYNNLGLLYNQLGKYVKAEKYYIKALKIKEKVLGNDHFDTASTYNNLANLYCTLGKYKEAAEYYFKVMGIFEKTLGNNHPDTASLYNNIAIMYKTLENYERAEEFYLKALKIRKKVLGEDHLDTARAYNNLASLYHCLRKHKIAEKYYLRSIKIMEKVVDNNHPDIATTYDNLGVLYYDLENYERAEEFYLKALKIREKVLGNDHPDTATTYNNLAILYKTLGNYKEAEKYQSKAKRENNSN